MELIKYLSEHCYTKEALLSVSKVTAAQLKTYQELGVMPKSSYKLMVSVSCDSFFGAHEETQKVEYYAKGYASWLGVLQALFEGHVQKTPQESQLKKEAYGIFYRRYKAELDRLKSLGYVCDEPKLNAGLDEYIEEVWAHFIEGIYGLCTQSGLPEDIAAKAVAIFEINQLSEASEFSVGALSEAKLKALENSVNLLDASSALFAPHERLRSSRHRLVDEIRRQFKLQACVMI